MDGVWQAWLYDPDPRWWTALSRWRLPADPRSRVDSGLRSAEQVHALSLAALDDPATGTSADGLVQAVTMTGHPIAEIAQRRILALDGRSTIDDVCLAAIGRPDVVGLLERYGLQPVSEPAAAAYFLLTGQQFRYWEHDPDQTLLARAYRELPALRPRLRGAIPDFGDVDAARVVVTALDGVTKEPAEVAYVAGRMADGHDWDGLWRFARGLPPAEASRALREADPGWRPSDLDEAELYLLLRSTDTAGLLNRVTALGTPRRFEVDGRVLHGAFSADATLTAMTVRRGSRVVVQVLDLEQGRSAQAYDLGADDHGPVSFAGRRLIACQPWPGDTSSNSTVWWFGDRKRIGRALPGRALDLRPVSADGAAQIALVQRSPRHQPELMTVRRHGPPATRQPRMSGLNWPPPGITSPSSLLATDPASGRIAVADKQILIADVVRGNRLRGLVLHSRAFSDGAYLSLCFDGPEHLIAADGFEVTRFQIAGWYVLPVARTDAARGLVVRVPYRNAVAVADPGQGIVYLDAETLERQDESTGGLTGLRGHPKLWAAPDGSHAACLDYSAVHVVLAAEAPLADLSRRALDQATGADEVTLATARNHPAIRERAGVLLDILEANQHLRRAAGGPGARCEPGA
ncbi:hypothetical protein Ait01nite_056850 [Actinoplanes italicus]|nr:hypothetical protein Ait01nite_056850 [Actinoplanes italicus]